MTRSASLLFLLAPALSGCALLAPITVTTVPPPAPSGAATARIVMAHGDTTWPADVVPPGEYDATWSFTCDVSLGFQGQDLFDTRKDGRQGSRTFTVKPNYYGTGMVKVGCGDSDTGTVDIRPK